jgi:hypothetical protein
MGGASRNRAARFVAHEERQSRVAADRGSDILLFDLADKNAVFDRKRQNTTVFRISGRLLVMDTVFL